MGSQTYGILSTKLHLSHQHNSGSDFLARQSSMGTIGHQPKKWMTEIEPIRRKKSRGHAIFISHNPFFISILQIGGNVWELNPPSDALAPPQRI
jgi:hypothetical protein